MKLKSLLPFLLVPVLILQIPLAAMIFKVDGWAWKPGSFVVAWVLMAGAGLAYRFISVQANGPAYRVATGLGVFTGLTLMWINGAVGIIGSEGNPANLLFAGVLVVGAIAAVVARFKPAGMARALAATAFSQFLVPVVALFVWPADFSPGVLPVFALNLVFVLLFSFAALLFRRAARSPRPAIESPL